MRFGASAYSLTPRAYPVGFHAKDVALLAMRDVHPTARPYVSGVFSPRRVILPATQGRPVLPNI